MEVRQLCHTKLEIDLAAAWAHRREGFTSRLLQGFLDETCSSMFPASAPATQGPMSTGDDVFCALEEVAVSSSGGRNASEQGCFGKFFLAAKTAERVRHVFLCCP